MTKNILIFAATSDMAKSLTDLLLLRGENVYCTYRSPLLKEHENLKKFKLELTDEKGVNDFFGQFEGIKFDAVINFQGVAISSPVEFLKTEDFQKQLDVSVFSLIYILRALRGKINPKGQVINISSMASYGLFPFLAPYSTAKAAADILLSVYEIETGVKTVSIKAGVAGTKFWQYSVNENDFSNFPYEYESAAKFLKTNALKNSKKGLSPNDIAKLIEKIIYSKNPKASYNIGLDSKAAALISKFKGRTLYNLIRKIAKMRIKRFQNE
ncbi:MAG: SDR family NAD(P)-dependent oxidoreductase [Candidatus Gastranaerophilales bacterium]|nr:SDR family NAD(P)-dependent oxidoreductase [Candidatus Gastranaerophilales bacterium]